jgi:DNA repair photolyase
VVKLTILPGISDRPEQLAEVVKAAGEAGATGVWTNLLFLRPGTREHFLEHLAEDWPELVPHYQELYRRRAYLGADESKPVRLQVSAFAREFGVADRRVSRSNRSKSRNSSHSRSDYPNTILWPCRKKPTPTGGRRSPA